MRTTRVTTWIEFLLAIWLVFPARGNAAEDRDMVFEGVNGDVTTNEYRAFIDKLNFQSPPTNNIGNLMADEKDAAKLHGMQTFYSFTHDRRVLDYAVVWSDEFLHARNDPVNGRIIWTGKRDLCWPNKATNDVQALHSGAENGDVIEHIVATAKLILEDPSLWAQAAPADKYGFGATYLDRAKTYVRECQRSAESTIVPWFVRSTKDGYRLYHPDSPGYLKACGDHGPSPWNQQQCIVGALLRLAQCHRLLNDGDTNIAYYEKITADSASWFFSTALPVSSRGRVCYDWAYVATLDIPTVPEDTSHADYDTLVFRAYQANLGPTRQQMQRLINTARFVLYQGTNRFAGQVNGTSNERRYERKYLDFEWIEMSVLDRELYKIVGTAVLTSHEYFDNVGVEAAVLAAKHYWATNQSVPAEMVEDATGIPPVPQYSGMSLRQLRKHVPLQGYCLLLWVGSELLLRFFQRSRSDVPKKRASWVGWLVSIAAFALGIMAAYRLPAWRIWWPIVSQIGYGLFAAGLVLRWYAGVFLGRRFMAIACAGAMLALFGWCLAVGNWATLGIIFLPVFAVQAWRIRAEQKT